MFPSDDGSEPLPATEIINVFVDPNPVVVGETALLTVVVKDSLRTDLVYGWSLRGAGLILGTDDNITQSDSNSIFMVGGAQVGVYQSRVEVSASGEGFDAQFFEVEVVSPE